jgi:hypothetical protein
MLTTLKIQTTVSTTKFGQAVRAVATLSMPSGSVSGKVQFLVDGRNFGAAQNVVNGVATSPLLVNAARRPLKPGAHEVGAVFVPDDTARYASAKSSVTHVVKKASTRLTLAVHPTTITARAVTVAPGVAVATGTVTFTLAGKVIGRAALHNRVATLRYRLSAAQAKTVSVRYGGNATLLGSSSSRALVSARAVGGLTSSL